MTSILKVDNIQNSSGTSAISIDSNGVVKQPQLPHVAVDFGATDGSGTFISSGSNAVLPFDNVYEGDTSLWNTSTYKFTAPVTGVYMLAIGLLNDGGATIDIDVYVNGTRVLRQGQASSGRYGKFSLAKKLTANDVVHFATPQSDNYHADTGTTRHSFATITLLG